MSNFQKMRVTSSPGKVNNPYKRNLTADKRQQIQQSYSRQNLDRPQSNSTSHPRSAKFGLKNQRLNTEFDVQLKKSITSAQINNRSIHFNLKNIPESIQSEELFIQNQSLKSSISEIVLQNQLQKTQMQKLEKQKSELLNLVSSSVNNPGFKEIEIKRSVLLDELRSKMKEQSQLIKKKDNEYLQLKKEMKWSKIKELEANNQQLSEDNQKLNFMLKESIKKNEYIQNVDEYIFNLKYELEYSEQSQVKYQQNCEFAQKECARLERTVQNQNKQLKIQEKLVKQLLSKDDGGIKINTNMNEKSKIFELQSQNSSLSSRLDDKIQAFTKLETEHNALKQQLNKQIYDLEVQLEIEQREHHKTKEQLVQIKQNQQKLLKRIQNPNSFFSQLSNMDSLTYEQQQEKQKKILTYHSVKLSQLTNIVYKLKFNLYKNRVDKSLIADKLFTVQQLREGKASIKELTINLQELPFMLSDEKQALLLARYLVEDNDEAYVIFDENLTNDVKIVKSIFKKLINKYDLLSLQEQELLEIKISKEITSKKFNFQQEIETCCYTRKIEKTKMHREDILKCINKVPLNIKIEEYEFILYKLYLIDGQIDVFDTQQFYSIFHENH